MKRINRKLVWLEICYGRIKSDWWNIYNLNISGIYSLYIQKSFMFTVIALKFNIVKIF